MNANYTNLIEFTGHGFKLKYHLANLWEAIDWEEKRLTEKGRWLHEAEIDDLYENE